MNKLTIQLKKDFQYKKTRFLGSINPSLIALDSILCKEIFKCKEIDEFWCGGYFNLMSDVLIPFRDGVSFDEICKKIISCTRTLSACSALRNLEAVLYIENFVNVEILDTNDKIVGQVIQPHSNYEDYKYDNPKKTYYMGLDTHNEGRENLRKISKHIYKNNFFSALPYEVFMFQEFRVPKLFLVAKNNSTGKYELWYDLLEIINKESDMPYHINLMMAFKNNQTSYSDIRGGYFMATWDYIILISSLFFVHDKEYKQYDNEITISVVEKLFCKNVYSFPAIIVEELSDDVFNTITNLIFNANSIKSMVL